MNPSYVYFKELAIDSENTFNLNFSKDNEIENIFLDKDYEYAVSGLNLNIKIPDERVNTIEDENKMKQISTEI